ncbi:MAG: GyrI-like domain-containing protein [Candidatus Kariarchaeaceae archaeon]
MDLSEPLIIDEDKIVLIGMEFFGDPFKANESWSSQNEIGLLWSRFSSFMSREESKDFQERIDTKEAFEVHIESKDTSRTKEFHVFVGYPLKDPANLTDIPLELVIKILPATKYALFTLKGKEITSNWAEKIYNVWLANSAFVSSHRFLIEKYDEERFKGLGEQLDESELDILIPVSD